MNTLFYITNGKVEKQAPIDYYNIIHQQAQDALNELGGIDFDRQSAEQYLDKSWRPNLTGDNLDTGEMDMSIEVTDEMWERYKNTLFRVVI